MRNPEIGAFLEAEDAHDSPAGIGGACSVKISVAVQRGLEHLRNHRYACCSASRGMDPPFVDCCRRLTRRDNMRPFGVMGCESTFKKRLKTLCRQHNHRVEAEDLAIVSSDYRPNVVTIYLPYGFTSRSVR